MDLMAKGGGEAVCMNVLEALSGEYDVTLITLTEPDFEELDAYFDTNVGGVDVRLAGVLAPQLHDHYGLQYYILQNALLGRYARRNRHEFDLLVSTINELGLGPNAVQYVHFPFDWSVNLDNREDIFHPTVEDGGPYEQLCTAVGNVDATDLRSNAVLANSEWTADAIENAYGFEPQVVYPPVDTAAFREVPWDQREPGFVALNRIERSKRILELIRIVDGVRNRGHGVHLHVVGPTIDEEYRTEVDALADERDYITIEGEVSRDRLVELVSTHRYGIHGKEHEHFGMSVAELAAGGTIPFIPSAGGQRVIVNGHEELLYDSVDDAVTKIDRVLSDPALESDLRISRDAIERRFGRDRFHREIRNIVSERLPATPTPVPAAADGSGDVRRE
ncbi:glycosyltransferase family 4 protein [Halobacterium zhouii]|uniref:glycosyltransferase family 4 protein n=1 Tax=Halobacterium zhouii TaxID=2902624 RepID=UPI001E4E4F44|nr:glycosyltransferase family 4 protein [Halobacterium zhouii]